jgi:hypothetical protein
VNVALRCSRPTLRDITQTNQSVAGYFGVSAFSRR